ncbi:MAG: nucleoside triphosphate pyrophosphohydrolase [Candidatus Cloacimonadota bacterium]|nr:MAG: nucleoside triphosphate pyrophosphohydrolase [Candidatus Cloacimonadota bacterium]PIE77755.1 MAG: nucleoside triphosphate pyrophosphohydrolase [Candidatus Delongbacteria bacterium]
MKKLRDPNGGCPWDLKQTHQTLKKYVLEEAYEVMDAIDSGDMTELKKELGDLLLQVVFQAQVAEEAREFNFNDVAKSISDKLVERHPHIFSDKRNLTPDEVEQNWEMIKKKKENKRYILEGIPRNYSSLLRSLRIQKRVAGVGFEWDSVDGVKSKIVEELGELIEAIDSMEKESIEEELGDLFFIMVNLAKRFDIDPEEALQKSNDKFTKRFNYIEDTLSKNKEEFKDKTLEELDKIWDEAKVLEKKGGL